MISPSWIVCVACTKPDPWDFTTRNLSTWKNTNILSKLKYVATGYRVAACSVGFAAVHRPHTHTLSSRPSQNGDLNWIVKDKILAFAGPSFERHVSPEGYCTLAPADYIPYFQRKKVELVVRLNKKLYHEQDFEQAGIRHMEAFFIDGSCPPMRILQQVLDGFESVPTGKAFAVHCKAGLGRTGTCIGAYLMKHYRFTAAEAIGWMRICRPGCVIGPQQHFLKQIESRMWQEGAASGPIPRSPPFEPEVRKMETDSVEALIGRAGQANALLAARGRRGGKSTVSDPPITPEQQQKGKPVPVTPESKVKLWF
jgi:protein-tyrosine phosphatase